MNLERPIPIPPEIISPIPSPILEAPSAILDSHISNSERPTSPTPKTINER